MTCNALRLESWIAFLLGSLVNSSEEVIEGFLKSSKDILKHMGVDRLSSEYCCFSIVKIRCLSFI